jgi:hypothetical protein
MRTWGGGAGLIGMETQDMYGGGGQEGEPDKCEWEGKGDGRMDKLDLGGTG